MIKINLLTFLDLYKIKNAKTKEEKRKAIRRVSFILFGLLLMSWSVYYYLETSMEGYMQLNIPYILLAQVFAMVSAFTLMTGFYKVNGILFGFKDYNLLLSLPIKKNKIILSKIFMLYMSNIIYTLLFMTPAYILYITNIKVNLEFNILYFITLFIIPILPIVISTIIGSIIVIISNRFKLKKLMNLVLTILFMTIITYGSYKLDNAQAIDLANIGKSMVNIFNKIYPLTGLYIDIIKESNIKSLILFIMIPIIVLYIFIKIIEKYFIKINNAITMERTKSNFKMKQLKTNNTLISLYKKELKKYFSSINYILNTSMGSILLTISMIIFVFFGKDKIDDFLGIEGLSTMFVQYGPIMLASFCLLNCTTHPSISLEGKSNWIMKSLPINPMMIFISKIMVNLTILLPTIFINATILSIYLKVSLGTYLLTLLLPILYSIFISILGIILNCFFINYEFKNETQIIKQSPQSFIIIIIALVLILVPINLKIDLNKYMTQIILIATTLDVLLIIFMKRISTKQFKND